MVYFGRFPTRRCHDLSSPPPPSVVNCGHYNSNCSKHYSPPYQYNNSLMSNYFDSSVSNYHHHSKNNGTRCGLFVPSRAFQCENCHGTRHTRGIIGRSINLISPSITSLSRSMANLNVFSRL